MRARVRGLSLRVKNIDAHVAVDLQRPGGGEHEQPGMRVEHRFLQLDRAHAKRVAHDDHGELDQHDIEAAPRRRPADSGDGAVDAVGDLPGDVLDAAVHGFGRLSSLCATT